MKILIYFFLVEKVNEQLIGPKQFFFSWQVEKENDSFHPKIW